MEISKSVHTRNLWEQFQTIIDRAPIPIYAKDDEHRYVVANTQADELAGFKRGEIVGQSDRAFMDPIAADLAWQGDHRILAGGSAFEVDDSFVIRGIEKKFHTVKFPLVNELDEIVAVGGISIDTTAKQDAIRLRDELATAQQCAIEELRLSREETVERLVKAIGHHDVSTGQHITRIGRVAAFLAGHLRLEPEKVELLRIAASMHDVGKIGTPREILCKPGPLSVDEREEMQLHTLVGYEILCESKSELLRLAATVALTHHECYDGTGYPHGLRGEEIPLEGRITAVADVFDALLSDRHYRPALSVEEVAALIAKGRGTQFDPAIADVLLDHFDEAISFRASSLIHRSPYLGTIASRPNSAGVLLFRLGGGDPEVLLVHPGGPYWAKKDLGAWSIPKGEYGGGEEPRDCALRELGEELGAAPALDPESLIDLGTVRQKGGKVVRAWAAEGDFDPAALRSNTFAMEWPPRSGVAREFPEVDRAEWFEPAEARRRILAAQAELVDRLVAHLEAA